MSAGVAILIAVDIGYNENEAIGIDMCGCVNGCVANGRRRRRRSLGSSSGSIMKTRPHRHYYSNTPPNNCSCGRKWIDLQTADVCTRACVCVCASALDRGGVLRNSSHFLPKTRIEHNIEINHRTQHRNYTRRITNQVFELIIP